MALVVGRGLAIVILVLTVAAIVAFRLPIGGPETPPPGSGTLHTVSHNGLRHGLAGVARGAAFQKDGVAVAVATSVVVYLHLKGGALVGFYAELPAVAAAAQQIHTGLYVVG